MCLVVKSQMEAASNVSAIVYLLFNLRQVSAFNSLKPQILHLYFGVMKPTLLGFNYFTD